MLALWVAKFRTDFWAELLLDSIDCIDRISTNYSGSEDI